MKAKHQPLYCRHCLKNTVSLASAIFWGVDNGAARACSPHEVENFLNRNGKESCSYCLDLILYGAGRNLVAKTEWSISFKTKLYVQNVLKYHFASIKEEV